MARMISPRAIAGATAVFAMAATPIAASAAELPVPTTRTTLAPVAGTFDSHGDTAERHRDWRGYRYRGYHRHRHRGIDAGDVFAGVLILGGIAAIASAANKDKRERERDYRYRDRDYRERDYDYRPRRGDSRYDGSRGIDNAVRMCVDRIERDVRVDSVDGVDRTGEGWRVTGALFNGEGFTCRIGADGRIDDIDYGGISGASFSEAFEQGQQGPAAGQWDDDRYAAARRTTDTDVPAREVSAEELPAYPGGPLPGEDTSASEDDRYRTAEAPDFNG